MFMKKNIANNSITQNAIGFGPIGVVIRGQLYLFSVPYETADVKAANYPFRYDSWEETCQTYCNNWTLDQLSEIREGVRLSLTKEELLLYMLPELSPEEMALLRKGIMAIKKQRKE